MNHLTPHPSPSPLAFCVCERDSSRDPRQWIRAGPILLGRASLSSQCPSMLSKASVLGSFLRLNNIPVCVCVYVCITFVYVFSSWWPLSCIHVWAVVNSAMHMGVPASTRPCPWSFLHVPREAPCKWSCVCPWCSAAWLPPPRIVCDTPQVAELCSFVRVITGVHPPSCRWTDTPGGCSGQGVRA